MFCSNCGKEIDEKAVVCVGCGCQVKNIIEGKSWLSTLLFCLFLGTVGAHRFYTGQTGSAIAQLLLTLSFFGIGISAIWAFIDLILILSKNFKTKDGKELI